MDDVMEIIQIVKECKDTELHIDTGEIKLSLFKGDVGESGRSVMNVSGPVCMNRQTGYEAPAPAPPPEKEPEKEEVQEAAAAPVFETVTEAFLEEGLVPIKASVTSVFYRKPSPEEAPFVEVGDKVEEDTVVCLLEVMKCFRQMTADVKGRIEKICAESNNMVEEGTILFLIRPE
jgi:acetyl-CoA carboxylase biotin carboxyl carrier protein